MENNQENKHESEQENKNTIVQLCDILHTTLGIDIELYNHKLECVTRLTDVEYPQELLPGEIGYFTNMRSNMERLESSGLYYHSESSFHLVFLDIKICLPHQSEYYVIAGPFLNQPFSDALLLNILHENKISLSRRSTFQSFYAHVPYLSERARPTAWMIVTLLTMQPQVMPIQTIYEQGSIKIAKKKIQQESELRLEKADIIKNYNAELKWRSAVSAGNIAAARQALSEMTNEDFAYRTPGNPLRAQKNLLFSINTLCRLAAVDGGANVVSVHEVSDLFAIQIEKAKTALDINALQEQIVQAYCDLVIDTQTNSFSPMVAKAIQYLYMNYSQAITRAAVADHVNFSEHYLSRTFKAETGMTIGQYLNHLRIREAIHILKSTTLPITEVALMVGFSTYARFSVEFKRVTGSTAKDYMRN